MNKELRREREIFHCELRIVSKTGGHTMTHALVHSRTILHMRAGSHAVSWTYICELAYAHARARALAYARLHSYLLSVPCLENGGDKGFDATNLARQDLSGKRRQISITEIHIFY